MEQPKRILIVDDEPNVTLVLSRSLRKLGDNYHVETAQSGHEALTMLEAESYALVITDYKMPKMSGLDLAIAVREVAPQTQVVLMTAHGTGALRNMAGDMELDGYIDKPFTMDQIREIVEAAVSSTEGEDPYRLGNRQVEDAVYDQLQALQNDTGARCVMLLSAGGYPIEVVGMVQSLDTSTIGTLVAANFMAAVELSRLLGNASIFKSSYHEGPDYNIYSYDVNGDVLLAVIFGAETKTGAVWFFTKQTASTLAEMDLAQASIGPEELEELTADLDRGLDLLFSSGDKASEEGAFGAGLFETGMSGDEGAGDGAGEFGDEPPDLYAGRESAVPAAKDSVDDAQDRDVPAPPEADDLLTLEDAISAGLVPSSLFQGSGDN
jgi:CheY-like chemotaxis protein